MALDAGDDEETEKFIPKMVTFVGALKHLLWLLLSVCLKPPRCSGPEQSRKKPTTNKSPLPHERSKFT